MIYSKEAAGYLNKKHARDPTQHCFYCGVKFARTGRAMRTRDHILPRAYRTALPEETKNIRQACFRCNGARGTLGHCCGLLMLVLMDSSFQPKRASASKHLIPFAQGELTQKKNKKKSAKPERLWSPGFLPDGTPILFRRARRGLIIYKNKEKDLAASGIDRASP